MAGMTEIIRKLPKVELHIHLAGSIRPATFLNLLEENDTDLSLKSLQDVEDFLHYNDFEDFILKYTAFSNSLLKPSDFALVMRDLAMGFVEENIKYAEVTISPLDHIRNGVDYRNMMAALDTVISEAESNYDLKINYIVDLVRDYGPESARETLQETVRLQNPRIVGIGLGGRETGHPCREFTEVFQAARAAGYNLVAHAGETGGPDSVHEAMYELQVDRIGHGIQAANDKTILRELVDMRIPLEICISSNVATGAVPGLNAHPVRKLLQERVMIVLGTDDPAMFRISLTQEYAKLHETFGITMGEIRQIILTGIQSAFIPDLQKHNMIRKFTEEFHQLRTQHSL